MIGVAASLLSTAISSPTAQIESGQGVADVLNTANIALSQPPEFIQFKDKASDILPWILGAAVFAVFIIANKGSK